MKNSKITKFLPLMLALMFCAPAFAVGESNEATSTFNLTLPDYLKIAKTAGGTETASVTYADNYSSATMTTPLTAEFTIISNLPTREVYLQASCPVSGGEGAKTNALYSTADSLDSLYLVFTNSTHLPDAAAITNITNSDKSKSADAIAFQLTSTTESHDNFPTGGVTSAWSAEKKQVVYTIKNGTTTLGYETATQVVPASFSTHDTKGTYQATLTMTKTTL